MISLAWVSHTKPPLWHGYIIASMLMTMLWVCHCSMSVLQVVIRREGRLPQDQGEFLTVDQGVYERIMCSLQHYIIGFGNSHLANLFCLLLFSYIIASNVD